MNYITYFLMILCIPAVTSALTLTTKVRTTRTEATAIDKCFNKYGSHILEASNKHNVDPKLILAIILVESTCNAKAKGALGEVGLMQIYPKWHPNVRFDAKQNILKGARIIASMKKYCGKRYIRCYNAGLSKRIDHAGKRYEKKILDKLEKIYDTYIYYNPGGML